MRTEEIIDSTTKFLEEVYSLKHIIRYNNIPKICQESVAEHTFFVTAIVLDLNKYYKFNLERAIIMATIHDFIESYIGDITRDVKNKYKVMAEAIEIAEKEAWPQFYPEYVEYINELEEQKTVTSKIVKLADVLSVVQYTKTEIKLGNSGYIQDVLEKSLKIVKEKFKELEEFKK